LATTFLPDTVPGTASQGKPADLQDASILWRSKGRAVLDSQGFETLIHNNESAVKIIVQPRLK